MTQDDLLYRFRLRVFAIAAELGNVRAAASPRAARTSSWTERHRARWASLGSTHRASELVSGRGTLSRRTVSELPAHRTDPSCAPFGIR